MHSSDVHVLERRIKRLVDNFAVEQAILLPNSLPELPLLSN